MINFNKATNFVDFNIPKTYYRPSTDNWLSMSAQIPYKSLYLIEKVEMEHGKIKVSFLEGVGSFTRKSSAPASNEFWRSVNKKVNYIMLWINNSETEDRMFKALKHLAYLAKEKREAKRKASGDKF